MAESPVEDSSKASDAAQKVNAARVQRERASLGPLGSLGFALGGALGPFLIMALDRRLAGSVPAVIASLLVSSFGWLALLRTFDQPVAKSQQSAPETRVLLGRQLVVPLARFLLSVVALIIGVRLCVAGILPLPAVSAGVLYTTVVSWCGFELFRLGRAFGAWRDADGNVRALLSHHGFWLLALNCLLHLPMLGNFGLIDPWETHYGEVAREILARDDWISLWWAQDGWFWSKPIANFWMQAISFKLFGVGYMPGQMLSGVARGAWPQPEWACRFGLFITTTIAVYTLYRALCRPFGKRTAVIGAGILSTCPYWFMLERQTMADMVYVAPLTAGLALLLLGFQQDPERLVQSFELRLGKRRFWVSGFHVLFACVLMTALPQILYLFTRNLTLHTAADLQGFRPHWDEFMQGSGGGNCGQPGNQGCANKEPLYFWGQPLYFGLLWTALLFGLLFWNRYERRAQRLLFLAGWYATALAVMGKGAPGLVIPLATALAFPVVQARLRDLLRLELPAMLMLVLCVALPWYVQMYMRHGWPFLDRLIMHDMVRRAFVHVHDTNEGDDVSFRYYLWQLGYGLFPWAGFAAAGLMWLARGKEKLASLRNQAGIFLLLWWLVAFGMFTITLTKFHHYILPLVPPTAMLAAVVVAEYLPSKGLGLTRSRKLVYAGALAVAALALVVGVAQFFPGRVLGRVSGGQAAPAAWGLGAAGIGIGVVLTVGAHLFARRAARSTSAVEAEGALSPADGDPKASDVDFRAHSAVLSVLALFSVAAIVLAGRDLSTANPGDTVGPARILHLFTYNYTRSWPEVLDFRGALRAFTIVAAAVAAMLAVRRLRTTAVFLFSACAVWFAAWCVDVYFVRVSPHWGQRETMLTYYQARKDESEPLIAYQMNWKGENFYTGNAMATFVSSGAKFKSWIKSQRSKGTSTFFVTTEHGRVAGLKRELEGPDSVELLTTKELDDKFVLAKVVFPPLAGGAHGGDAAHGDDEPEAGDKPGSLE